MEQYYTVKEYNTMRGTLTRQLKAAKKEIDALKKKLYAATHVTEESDSNE